MKCRRTPSNLSESTHRQLNAYCLAATAAGVGVLALAQHAEARVVYTPANTVLLPDQKFGLDLNHDGINDLRLSIAVGGTSVVLEVAPWAYYSRVNGVCGTNFLASALRPGVRVGGLTPPPLSRGKLMAGWSTSRGPIGHWVDVKNRYLGLWFAIKGKTHYGWARLNVEVKEYEIIATLTGYAYETIANKPIVTGKTKGSDEGSGVCGKPNPAAFTTPGTEPATLGQLALGAPGLSIWRRKESGGVTGSSS
jgi:hypothetical protein